MSVLNPFIVIIVNKITIIKYGGYIKDTTRNGKTSIRLVYLNRMEAQV